MPSGELVCIKNGNEMEGLAILASTDCVQLILLILDFNAIRLCP